MASKSMQGVFCALVILLASGCGSSQGGSPDGGAERNPGEPPTQSAPTTPSAMEKFQNDCENQVQQWQKARADYITDMSMFVGRTETYSFAIDVNDVPRPPDQIIASGDPVASRDIKVKCLLRAKLVAVGDGLSVAPDALAVDGWTYRAFTPEGVARWAWSVTPTAPVQNELRVELAPAVEKDEVPIVLSDNFITQFTTKVSIDGTGLDRASYWFNVQFPLAKGIAGAVGAALVGLLAWLLIAKTDVLKLFKRPETDADGKQNK